MIIWSHNARFTIRLDIIMCFDQVTSFLFMAINNCNQLVLIDYTYKLQIKLTFKKSRVLINNFLSEATYSVEFMSVILNIPTVNSASYSWCRTAHVIAAMTLRANCQTPLTYLEWNSTESFRTFKRDCVFVCVVLYPHDLTQVHCFDGQYLATQLLQCSISIKFWSTLWTHFFNFFNSRSTFLIELL